MAIANTSLSDTFNVWRTRFNQVVLLINALTEGQANSTGTLTITNPTYLGGNVSLNVSNGFIRVKGNTFDANTITVVSNNSNVITVSGAGSLGSKVYIDVGLSTSNTDQSTANAASANLAFKKLNKDGGTITGDLIITGNLTISGTGVVNLL